MPFPSGFKDDAFPRRLLLILILAAALLASVAARAQPPDSPEPTTSTGDLKNLVGLLEDPERREAFIRDLKQLIALQEGVATPKADEGTEVERAIDNISDRIDYISHGLSRLIRHPATWLHYLPNLAHELSVFLNDRKDRARLTVFSINLLAAVLAAWLLGWLMRRVHWPPPDQPLGRYQQLAHFLRIGISENIRPLLLWLFLGGLFSIQTTLPAMENVVMAVCGATFLFGLATKWAQHGLSPGPLNPHPLAPEHAAFIRRWITRFSRYAAIYYVANIMLLETLLDRTAYLTFRGVLLLAFPILATVFVPRAARLIRAHYAGRPPSAPAREAHWLNKALGVEPRYLSFLIILFSWSCGLFVILHESAKLPGLIEILLGSVATLSGSLILLGVQDLTWKSRFTDHPRLERFWWRLGIGVKLALVGTTAVLLGTLWNIFGGAFLEDTLGRLPLERIFSLALTLGIAAGLIKASQWLARWLLREREHPISRQQRTLLPILKTAFQLVVSFVTCIVVLRLLGVNVAPILAGAGIAGIAVGLGAQSLIKDIINGLFILFQDIIAVGDWAVIGDKNGLVEQVGLRAIRLRDLSNNVHLIPNSSVDVITNMTKEFSGYVFDVGVAYRESVDEVIGVMEDLGREMMTDPVYAESILQPLEVLGLDRFEDSAVVIRARFTTRPLTQWAVGREYNKRLKKRFDELGIEIPFPHRTLYMGQPKTGDAPPLPAALAGSPKPGGPESA